MSVDFDSFGPPAAPPKPPRGMSPPELTLTEPEVQYEDEMIKTSLSEVDPALVMAASLFVQEVILRAQIQVDEKFANVREEDDEFEDMVR